ncbi:Arp2/3 complex, 34 kd subunit p34-Arc-domain-containing protein [Jimgerdemannia flammicorona]|uniref:Arp2/3 complex, 34 kd subunit p34-Arc-domain-containing protein n=1 Tax=Jimgerdemannia flammicorona TaxID=994334 RepID=A0A433QVK4_9FUNG|nr:Arp2/3 complex, 34 kd subunit p34-Arc-domain-containing protein [Jimgerdemannia flammicorona]
MCDDNNYSQSDTSDTFHLHPTFPPAMILLDYHNVIINDVLTARFLQGKQDTLDMTIVDFDGVSYHLFVEKVSKTTLTLSMRWSCFQELVKFGANDILKHEYGQYIAATPEQGYNLTLEFDSEKLPEDIADREALIKKVSVLKRNLLSAPFVRAIAELEQFEDSKQPDPTPELMAVHYRDEETIFVQAAQDRVTVTFSTLFKEEADRVIGRVFLQEFVDARKGTAPQVIYSPREPPLEIRHLPGLQDSESVGYITFILFPRHLVKGEVREETISRIQIFRDYLHYHIKCSKAYLHSRMRARVTEFLKVLNRAKPEVVNAEKKTVTWVFLNFEINEARREGEWGSDVFRPCGSGHRSDQRRVPSLSHEITISGNLTTILQWQDFPPRLIISASGLGPTWLRGDLGRLGEKWEEYGEVRIGITSDPPLCDEPPSRDELPSRDEPPSYDKQPSRDESASRERVAPRGARLIRNAISTSLAAPSQLLHLASRPAYRHNGFI